MCKLQARHEHAARHFAPRNMHEEHHGHVRKNGQPDPLEHRHVDRIGQQGQREHRHNTDRQWVHMPSVGAGHHLDRRRHAADVGADIDGVGNRDQRDDEIHHARPVMAADIAGQPVTGHAADTRTDLLHGCDQRKGEQRHPQHRWTEPRAGLGIGRDTARVVIGNAGDEPRADLTQRFFPFGFHSLRSGRRGICPRACQGRLAHCLWQSTHTWRPQPPVSTVRGRVRCFTVGTEQYVRTCPKNNRIFAISQVQFYCRRDYSIAHRRQDRELKVATI